MIINEFFFELSNIPQEYIREYLNRKLRRKGGEENISYRLLLKLEYYRKRNIISKWNDEKIGKQLKATPSAIAIQRYRLLRDLRKLTLNSGIVKNKTPESAGVLNEFTHLKEEFELGYYREAVRYFLIMERKLKTELRNSKDTTVNFVRKAEVLFEIWDLLSLHYLHVRNKRKLSEVINTTSLFYKKVSEKPEMYEKLLKSKIKIDALTDEILCRKLILYSSSVHRMSVYRKLKSKNLKKFVKLNDHERIYKISISISVTLRLEGKFEEARQVLTYALTHSINNSHDSEAKLFNLLILELDYYENKISGVDFFRQCKNCYESYTLGKTKSYMLYTALWCLCKIANYIDSEQDVKKYSVELIKVCSIIGRKYEAADRSFWIKSDKMKSDIVKWKIDKEKDILIPYFDKIAHQNFADSFFSFQRHSYEINNINRLALIYLFNIEIEFWKLSGADFEKVYLMLNKLIRLVKKHNTSVKQVWINFNKTFFKFLDESRFVKSDTIYKRYSVQINSVLKGLMDKSMKYNIITEYAQIYIISEYYNCNELKTDAKILFNWIRKNRPEILLYAYNSVDKNDKPEKLSSL